MYVCECVCVCVCVCVYVCTCGIRSLKWLYRCQKSVLSINFTSGNYFINVIANILDRFKIEISKTRLNLDIFCILSVHIKFYKLSFKNKISD